MYVQEFSVSKPIAVQQKPRKLTRVESIVRELSSEVAILNSEMAAEEKKSGVNDPNHYAYSCYAKAVMRRRDNLLSTIEQLKRWAMAERLVRHDGLTALQTCL
jgi:flagellar protein FliJ